MKETYHICFTSHDEVMFRDQEDHEMFVNLLALRGFSHETLILADAEMSTHVHLCVMTDRPRPFAGTLRMSYAKYFNHKYDRKGHLGQNDLFLLKVDGLVHILTLINYILRNGLHHAAASTAFGYLYCSVRELFTKDIGLMTDPAVSMSRAVMAGFLPRHAQFPDHYQMNARGMFVRSSFMELQMVERYYVSPRNYLYQMNRLTDESWSLDQAKDHTGKAITLGDIEQASERDIAQMLKNESGKLFNPSRMQDLDVCRLIDKSFLPSYGVPSVYLLSDSQKERIAKQLQYDFHLPWHQIRRCLVLAR